MLDAGVRGEAEEQCPVARGGSVDKETVDVGREDHDEGETGPYSQCSTNHHIGASSQRKIY